MLLLVWFLLILSEAVVCLRHAGLRLARQGIHEPFHFQGPRPLHQHHVAGLQDDRKVVQQLFHLTTRDGSRAGAGTRVCT